MLKDPKTTNLLLLIIVIPLIFYLLKILSFIFIPLTLAMFLSLLFLPLMRGLKKKNIPKPISILIVIIIIFGVLKAGGELIQLSTNEISSSDNSFSAMAETKVIHLVESIERSFGIKRSQGDNILSHYFKSNNSLKNLGSTLDFIGDTVTMTLMTVFFLILLLSGSINVQNILNKSLIKSRISSIKVFAKIENNIIKFVFVKFLISLLTGIGFSLACVFFDVSFPIFWGLFAFLINFIQMVGSVISVITLSLFAFVEIDPSGTLVFFILIITAVQVIMGGVLEPIFMGKTFSLNIITVLVMLMLWGFIWRIPGLIMAIPITVFIKIILEQFESTRVIAGFMSGNDSKLKLSFKRKN